MSIAVALALAVYLYCSYKNTSDCRLQCTVDGTYSTVTVITDTVTDIVRQCHTQEIATCACRPIVGNIMY